MRSTEPIILAEILAVCGEEGVKSQSLQVETNTWSVEADYPYGKGKEPNDFLIDLLF